MITTVCFYQETPGKWHVSRLQSHTKTGWTSDHPIDSCVCATVGDHALTAWQQDEDKQIGTWSWHIVPFDIQSAAYVTWWVNGSVRVGQDWCKRVCWQAEISGSKMSCARLLWRILPPVTSDWACCLRSPSSPKSYFLSTEVECPYRHGNYTAEWVKHSVLPYGTPEARWAQSAHTHICTPKQGEADIQ